MSRTVVWLMGPVTIEAGEWDQPCGEVVRLRGHVVAAQLRVTDRRTRGLVRTGYYCTDHLPDRYADLLDEVV